MGLGGVSTDNAAAVRDAGAAKKALDDANPDSW
jgi:hypothetical protein